jgi:hypothetical protein
MDSAASKPGHVRKDAPEAAAPAIEQPEADRAEQVQRGGRGWRIALFIWVSAFAFLVAYELLSMVLRVLNVR